MMTLAQVWLDKAERELAHDLASFPGDHEHHDFLRRHVAHYRQMVERESPVEPCDLTDDELLAELGA